LYVDFAGYGLYEYDGTAWSQLTPNHPASMTAAGSILYASFAGYGLYKYDSGTWTQITPNAPTSMTTNPSPASTCTYTYSAWSACQPNGTQTRTVVSSSPAGCTGTPVLSQSCTYTPPPPSSSQVWLLNFGDAPCGMGLELAKVRVTPFTYSGAFSETSDSPGVYIWGPTCTCSYRLRIGGNVVHSTPYDRWDFVNVGGAGCGMQTLCTVTGTANGNFPNATSVNGSITCTTQSPLGQSTGSGTWQGTMVGY
jgi:hypothetical protein